MRSVTYECVMSHMQACVASGRGLSESTAGRREKIKITAMSENGHVMTQGTWRRSLFIYIYTSGCRSLSRVKLKILDMSGNATMRHDVAMSHMNESCHTCSR